MGTDDRDGSDEDALISASQSPGSLVTSERTSLPRDSSTDANEQEKKKFSGGRPKFEEKRRRRITMRIDPSSLPSLRNYALCRKKSLGQLIDEYVDTHYPAERDGATGPFSEDEMDVVRREFGHHCVCGRILPPGRLVSCDARCYQRYVAELPIGLRAPKLLEALPESKAPPP
jgi:hypothetical protein